MLWGHVEERERSATGSTERQSHISKPKKLNRVWILTDKVQKIIKYKTKVASEDCALDVFELRFEWSRWSDVSSDKEKNLRMKISVMNTTRSNTI